MSVITANPSVVSLEGRSRASSKHLRNYQKVSEVNLDEKTILSYLRSHNLHRTLATFVSETHYSQNIEPLLKIIEAGGIEFTGNIQTLLKSIQSQCEGKENKMSQKWLIVEFYLHIWYCVGKSHLEKSRIFELKNYINIKGDTLSEIPELLAYFALPYADSPMTHPFLKRIFTVEWREELKSLILNLTGKRQEHKHEQQWLNIIEDMIEICTQLYSNLENKSKTDHLTSMMERVSLYQYVIQKNKDSQSQKHEKQAESIDKEIKQLDYADVQNIKKKIVTLRVELTQSRKLGNGLELDLIYHGIQRQLSTLQKFKEDKKYIKKLINHDILGLQHRGQKMEYEELKLLQMIASYYEGRNYIQKYENISIDLKSIIGGHYKQPNMKENSVETLTICFDVLRKIAIRQKVFKKIIEEKGLVDLILKTFETFKVLYLKGGKSLYTKALTANTRLLTQLVLHRKGRETLQKKNYFELIADFFKQIKTISIDEFLQNELCSSIYLLLVEQEIRVMANIHKIKDILLDRMLSRRNQRYQILVGYIIQRIEMDEEIEEGTSDIDEEKSVEYDSGININDEFIHHQGEIIKIEELKKIQNKQEEYRHKNHHKRERKSPSQEKTGKVESKQKKNRRQVQEEEIYSPQKYEWKSKSSYIRDAKNLKEFKF